MAQYKCVPGPGVLSIKKIGQYDEAVRAYADIIQAEAVGGWEFHSMQPIQICLKAGLFSKVVLKSRDDYFEVQMLVFKKE